MTSAETVPIWTERDRDSIVHTGKRPLELQHSTGGSWENYSTTNTCATFYKEERPRWQNLEPWRIFPSRWKLMKSLPASVWMGFGIALKLSQTSMRLPLPHFWEECRQHLSNACSTRVCIYIFMCNMSSSTDPRTERKSFQRIILGPGQHLVLV